MTFGGVLGSDKSKCAKIILSTIFFVLLCCATGYIWFFYYGGSSAGTLPNGFRIAFSIFIASLWVFLPGFFVYMDTPTPEPYFGDDGKINDRPPPPPEFGWDPALETTTIDSPDCSDGARRRLVVL